MWYKEGRVKFRVPENPQIFFNPKGELARTIGVLSLRVWESIFNEPIKVADAFTGIGLRAFRYLLETTKVMKVFANDAAPYAFRFAQENARVLGLSDKIDFFNLEANRFFWWLNVEEIFPHLVDIDTFGSPSPFLDSAFFAVRVPGLLYITSTDLAPLCGVRQKAALRNYSAFSRRTYFCHETGLRAVLWAIISAGGRHGLFAKPLISFFDGHAFRFLLYVEWGRENFPVDKIGFVIYYPKSREVDWIKGINLSQKYQKSALLLGPLWLGDLHELSFLESVKKEIHKDQKINEEASKLVNFIEILKGENGLPPYFFSIPHASKLLGISPPSTRAVVETLKSWGFRAVFTHFSSTGLKTNAPHLTFLSAVKESARKAKPSGH